MSKCLAIKTGENTLEPTAQTNNTLNAIKLALLQKQAMQNFAPNDEIWITESGEFEVPYDGVYEVTLIDGGQGGWAFIYNDAIRYGLSGWSGCYQTRLAYYQKGQIVPVTIGAGGTGISDIVDNLSIRNGGKTSFGDINNLQIDNGLVGTVDRYSDNTRKIESAGGGFGGGGVTSNHINATFYGGGGSALVLDEVFVGNGMKGAVRLRFFNPEKASLPAINDTDLIPYLTLLQRLDTLEKIVSENLMWNDEITITESGNFEVPYDGYYEVTCIAGGTSGAYYKGSQTHTAYGGNSGFIFKKLVKLFKGQIVPVTIGAGGTSIYNNDSSTSHGAGGVTSFGDISSSEGANFQAMAENSPLNITVVAVGAGLGGGHFEFPPFFYGGGGSVSVNLTTNARTFTDGYQGCVKLRLHNPNKNQGV